MTEPMQRIAATDLRKILGDKLCVVDSSSDSVLPSPESLKGKILIKAKKGKVVQQEDEDVAAYSDDDEDDVEELQESSATHAQDNPSLAADSSSSGAGKARGFISRTKDKLKHMGSGTTSGSTSKPEAKSAAKVISVVPELSELVSFAGGNRKKIMESWKAGQTHPVTQSAAEIVSLSESKLEVVYENGLSKCLTEYNKRNITRVYPKGARVDSSNYNPLPAWGCGCQLVALNWQTADMPMWLYHGRFIANGGCGYVPRAPSELSTEIKGHGIIELEVLCGRLLPRPANKIRTSNVTDPYVEVCIASSAANGTPRASSERTPVVSANGWSPCWQHSMKLVVQNAEEDLLLLCVWDEDTASMDDLIGFCCAPVCTLRTGYRSFNLLAGDCSQLRFHSSTQLPTIMCHISWNSIKI